MIGSYLSQKCRGTGTGNVKRQKWLVLSNRNEPLQHKNPEWLWSTICKDCVSWGWKYLISLSNDTGYSPGINKGSKFVKQFCLVVKKWVPLTYAPVDCVWAAYLLLVLWKTYYNKRILLLLILINYSYTEWAKWAIYSNGSEIDLCRF